MAGNKKIYIGSIKVQKISACDCGVLGSKWDIHTHIHHHTARLREEKVGNYKGQKPESEDECCETVF